MKRATFILALAALIGTAVFAQERGLAVKVEISSELVTYLHKDLKNDTFVEDVEMPKEDSIYFLRNPSYGDVEFDVRYTDPNEQFGGKIGFRYGSFYNTNLPIMEDLYGWVKVSPYFRGKLGRYTERVVEKVGGDKDLGVLLFDVGASDMTINTSDSLGLGSSVIGFIPTFYIPLGNAGEVAISGFAAPNEYWLGKRVTPPYDQNNQTPTVTINGYSTYKFGGSLKYTHPDWVTVGLAYSTYHTEAEEGIDAGIVYQNFGAYAIVNILRPDQPEPELEPDADTPARRQPRQPSLKVGVGYSGHIYVDEKTRDDEEVHQTFKSGIHFDVNYTNVIPGLSFGLYNNLSFHTLTKDKTYGYVESNADAFGDEKSFVLYNQLDVSYDITEKLTTSLMFRNYYAELLSWYGGKGMDFGKETFIVEALGKYNVTKDVQARGGVKFELNKYGTPESSPVLVNDSYAISIPIGLIVKW